MYCKQYRSYGYSTLLADVSRGRPDAAQGVD